MGAGIGAHVWWAKSHRSRVARAAAKLVAIDAPPVRLSEGLFLPRNEVTKGIAADRRTECPNTVLVTGDCGAGKSMAAKSAFKGQQGVVYTNFNCNPTDTEPIDACWAAQVLQALGMHSLALQGEAALRVLKAALQEIQRNGKQRPVFIIDVDAAFASAQMCELLRMCKELGADASLAHFVVVATAAHTVAGLRAPLSSLCAKLVEIGDLETEEAQEYVKGALRKWCAAHGAVITQSEESNIIDKVLSKCGTRVLYLKVTCHGSWGRCETLPELNAAIEADAERFERWAVWGLDKFLALVPATAARAQQLEVLRQFASDSKSGTLALDRAASAFGITESRFIELNLDSAPGAALPFTIVFGTRQVRAASVHAQRAMLKQVAAWESE
ncbi:hypothetical protein JKP88DRAFT_251184 [Tribonema minus]|uniref:Uncharacterized protein n=1 Tax=Tribonema minus TaxID=303371 RepID=A0A836CNN5_9STRA|nr:hypothetical protein JKP88DRAFT_251184 [Tribonema minus]